MSTMVKDDDRSQWMIDNFGNGNVSYSLIFENYFYTILHESAKEFNGGWFDFFEEDNGAKWLCIGSPAKNKIYHVIGMENQYEGDMSGEALCLGAMIIATNHLIWKYYQTNERLARKFNELFEKIEDFASNHKEADQIFQFID